MIEKILGERICQSIDTYLKGPRFRPYKEAALSAATYLNSVFGSAIETSLVAAEQAGEQVASSVDGVVEHMGFGMSDIANPIGIQLGIFYGAELIADGLSTKYPRADKFVEAGAKAIQIAGVGMHVVAAYWRFPLTAAPTRFVIGMSNFPELNQYLDTYTNAVSQNVTDSLLMIAALTYMVKD